jgi:hypothetical protein
MSEMNAVRWTYYNPVRITAGAGCLADIAQALPAAGHPARDHAGLHAKRGMTARLAELLGDRLLVCDVVTPNPELEDVDALTEISGQGCLRHRGAGGRQRHGHRQGPVGHFALCETRVLESVCVRARARLAGAPASRRSSYHLRYRGGSDPFCNDLGQSTASKYSVTGDEVIPAHVFLDPNLTLACPPTETLHSALDAISHALESIWNNGELP